VSLLKLNTFAHCISALLIYIFWWGKPYDVEIHTFVASESLDFFFLLELGKKRKVSWMKPLMYVQHGSDRTDQYAVAYISDSTGNCLVRMNRMVFEKPLAMSFDDPSFARFDLGSKTKIGDTGLYISFESSVGVSAPIYNREDVDNWRDFGTAWIESGRPLPPKPITLTARWFYGRTAGSPDLDTDLDRMTFQPRPTLWIVMTFTFLAYGGLHLLAWQYNFKTRSERYLWRISAVTSASTGLIMLVLYIAIKISKYTISAKSKAGKRFYSWAFVGFLSLWCLLVFFNIASRAFLVIESFIALPNSPLSTYTIPSWTAYIPHI
jgi:hypothetical protein